MGTTKISHRRTHNVLLISKLLNQREGTSPLTLVVDSLEQPARPLIKEYIRRANLSKSHVLYLSYQTARVPRGVDVFVPCWNKTAEQVAQDATAAITAANRRCIVIIDSTTSLCNAVAKPRSGVNLTNFLMSLLQPSPQAAQASASLIAIHHQDVPMRVSRGSYTPNSLALLEYLATTIISLHSLPILLAEKQAQERSLGAPSFGLAEQKQGLLLGQKPFAQGLADSEKGLVMQLEHRRKSGRGVLEWYFLPDKVSSQPQHGGSSVGFREQVCLLDDHPRFRVASESLQDPNQDLAGMTFQLGLSDRQRLERDGVVLPYFDAQKMGGGGEGGRILYDMGVEDDFDEEEDEI